MKRNWLGLGRLPHPQRSAAVLLVLLQCVALVELMQATVFATLSAAIALGGLLAAQYGLVRTIHRSRWLLFLSLAFTGKYLLSPEEFSFDIEFINTPLSYELGCFFVVVQLVVLYARQYAERLPPWFSGAASAGLVFSSDVRVNSWTRSLMLVIVALHCIAVVWFSAASRRRTVEAGRSRGWLRWVLSAGCASLAVLIGSTGSVLIHRYEQELESAVASLVSSTNSSGAYPGISDSGGLHDITDQHFREGNRVALRVIANSTPGYLRGRAFDRFEHDRWLVTISAHPRSHIPRTNLPETPRKQDHAFELRPSRGPFDLVDVWPDEGESTRVMFLPQSTSLVFTRATSLDVDPALSAVRPPGVRASPYTAAIGEPSGETPLEKMLLPVYLLVPEDLDRRIPLLAAALTRGAQSVPEKVARIETFFRSRFEYKIVSRGRRVPGESALSEFLFDDQTGHCEYFATASVLLLRMAGVPARYVTGYVADEWNAAGGFWVARRKHAHAWAEAYDVSSRRWILVESTPSDGLPHGGDVSAAQQRREALAFMWQEIRQRIRQWRAGDFLQALTSPWVWLGSVSVAALAAAGSLVSWRPRWRKGRPGRSGDEGNPRLSAERRKVDHFVGRRGCRRRDDETVVQFAERIESEADEEWARVAARWYRDYARARFGGGTADDSLKQLSEARRLLLRWSDRSSRRTGQQVSVK